MWPTPRPIPIPRLFETKFSSTDNETFFPRTIFPILIPETFFWDQIFWYQRRGWTGKRPSIRAKTDPAYVFGLLVHQAYRLQLENGKWAGRFSSPVHSYSESESDTLKSIQRITNFQMHNGKFTWAWDQGSSNQMFFEIKGHVTKCFWDQGSCNQMFLRSRVM